MTASRGLLAALALIALAALGTTAWILHDRLGQDQTLAGPGLIEAPTDLAGPFALTDHQGQAITQADLAGKLVLLYFGYSFCPDICPTTLLQLSQAVERLGPEAEEVRILFVSVDPERDNQAVLASYVAAFSDRMIGATGSSEALEKLARDFGVYFRLRKDIEPVDYPVDHSGQFYLMGRDWELLAVFRPGARIEDIEEALRRVL